MVAATLALPLPRTHAHAATVAQAEACVTKCAWVSTNAHTCACGAASSASCRSELEQLLRL